MNKKVIQKLMLVMHDVQRMTTLAENESENEKNLSMLQLQAVKTVEETPGITVGAFAENMIMSSAATAQLLDRLVTGKMIEKKSDDKDKRITRLHISESGLKKIKITQQKMCKKMESIFSLLSDEDLETLLRIQEDLRTKLQKRSSK